MEEYLIVKSGRHELALNIDFVEEIIRLDLVPGARIEKSDDRPILNYSGKTYYIFQVFATPGGDSTKAVNRIIICISNNSYLAIPVDSAEEILRIAGDKVSGDFTAPAGFAPDVITGVIATEEGRTIYICDLRKIQSPFLIS
jgi:chemotaxis signal transduction protein